MDNYEKISLYINTNPLGVIGTISNDGTPHGAVVHLCTDDSQQIIYFLTKNETTKYRNLVARPAVSLTIVNAAQSSTLQLAGKAFVLRDNPETIDMVFKKITRANASAQGWLPPIVKLRAGAYEIIGIQVLRARLAEFKGAGIGDRYIFTAFDSEES